MTEIKNTQNLDAHYTNKTKIERKPMVVKPPENLLPQVRLWDDEKANLRIKALNQDIYEKSKPKKKGFWQ